LVRVPSLLGAREKEWRLLQQRSFSVMIGSSRLSGGGVRWLILGGGVHIEWNVCVRGVTFAVKNVSKQAVGSGLYRSL
jgi:hypothetical protein